jgi:GntR family transcriptional regulator, transcriptional repressor for pyruvate dehydrogenase complex
MAQGSGAAEGSEPNGSPFRPEKVRRPREQVETQIRAAILDGEFGPGDRLPTEATLARDFGVSRSTVREALRSLAEAGFIATSPGATGGSFVAGIDHHALSAQLGEGVGNILRMGSLTYAELAAVRLMLEIPSARLAARFHTPEHLVELDRIIDEQKRVEPGPSRRDLNARFHATVADASGNRLLAAIISALHWASPVLAQQAISADVSRRSARHHLRVVAAIRAGDEAAAEAAMRDDVREFEHADRDPAVA